MKERDGSQRDRYLMALFAILIATIFCLIIWIIMIGVNQNDIGKNIEDEWSNNTECFDNGTSYDIEMCISDIYMYSDIDSEAGRDELVIGLYNKAIDDAFANKDYSKARELLVSRSGFFVLNNDCDRALELLDDRSDGLDGDEKGIFYSYALDMGVSCDNEEATEKWNNLLMIYNEENSDVLGF